MNKLDDINSRNVKFSLSNVLRQLLANWITGNSDYFVNNIKTGYLNSNYQTKNRDKLAALEVLITNYIPQKTNTLPQVVISNSI